MTHRSRPPFGWLALVIALAGFGATPSAPVEAAPPGDDAVIAFAVNGVGNGHGRGLSQWGSYGRALAGQGYREILAAYYGGTQAGSRSGAGVRVRLTGWDGAGTVGVISHAGAARWNGAAYKSLMAVEVGPGTFDVYGSMNDVGCPTAANLVVPTTPMQPGATGENVRQMQRVLAALGHDPGPIDGIFGEQTATAVKTFQMDEGLAESGHWDQPTWVRAQQRVDELGAGAVAWAKLTPGAVAGPVVFTTSEGEAAPADRLLGLCKADSSVVHYRGSVEIHHTGDGNRVVNALGIDAYLRGVVPRESPAHWGDGGGGLGINALRAQSVAARSYALTQTRYDYAGTCDTSSCQVYGGAATRVSARSGARRLEADNTDRAIADTAGEVRVWPDGTVVSTEFSASNGPYTAGGQFPSVDDAEYDDHPDNPLHRWTRIIDVDHLAATYGLSRADAIRTVAGVDQRYTGIWSNGVVLGDGRSVSAWDFRNAFNLPAPGFELVPITRAASSAATFAYIGDSVGVGIAGEDASPLRVLLEGVHAHQYWNSRSGRPTGGGADDGAAVAATVPQGTNLAVVELGYNDTPSQMDDRIDSVMAALRGRGVEQVLWVTVSERRANYDYAATNQHIRAAEARWPELDVVDWEQASRHAAATRWFDNDGVHLTTTGNAEFSLFLRSHIVNSTARPVAAESTYRVPVLGQGGIPAGATAAEAGVAGVALNVTAVNPAGPGYLRVWDCAAEPPDTSSVNFMAAGAVEPNAVVVPLASHSSEVCVFAKARTHVIVDVAGWFAGGVQSAAGRLVDTRAGAPVESQGVLRVPVFGQAGVPPEGVAGVALNVTATETSGAGWLRVWDCAVAEPDTSSVNYLGGSTEPNAVIVPFAAGSPGEVCVRSLVGTDVIVDVAGWFDTGVAPAAGRIADTRYGIGPLPQ